MTKEYLSVKKLSVSFSETVLDGVFLNIKKGEFVSIVGKSGEGKTTLLNCLAGLQKHDGDIKKPEKIAIVFQNYSLFPWMTIRQNIEFGLNEGQKDIFHAINYAGLIGKENYYPKQLSGGQQQRTAIARAIVSKPNLLLLDEPFANLDSYTRLQMQDWLNQVINESNVTTVLVTHDLDEAILLSDRIFLLKDKSIHSEYNIPFARPRTSEIKYEHDFQELKKQVMKKMH